MKIRLNKAICYFAGMQSKWRGEDNSLGICSSNAELVQKFVEIAIKEFGEEAEKIKVSDNCAYFYNSRLSKQIKKVIDKRAKLFREPSENALSYIAGMLDSSGKLTEKGIYIKLDHTDELMLENLGIHTKQGYVMNLSKFIMLIKPYSLLLSSIRLPGNERDPC